MAELIPVQYGKLKYPKNEIPSVGEISVNFKKSKSDIEGSIKKMKEKNVQCFSLHTQDPYSGNDGKMDSNKRLTPIVVENNLAKIRKSQNDLWTNEEWDSEFVNFLREVSSCFEDKNSVKVIELHPPRLSKKEEQSEKVDRFIKKLKLFYTKVSPIFPDAEIVVENSNGSGLLLSSVKELNEFSDKIDELRKENFKIGIALDIPQLLYATKLRYSGASREYIEDLFKNLEKSKHNVRSIHLSGAKGKDYYGHSHRGDLNTLFDHGNTNGNPEERENVKRLKASFLKGLSSILSDENKRYFVPELNSGEDGSLKSIISDLEQIGVKFDYSPPC